MKDFIVTIYTTKGNHEFECKAENFDDAINIGRKYSITNKLGCVREISAFLLEEKFLQPLNRMAQLGCDSPSISLIS